MYSGGFTCIKVLPKHVRRIIDLLFSQQAIPAEYRQSIENDLRAFNENVKAAEADFWACQIRDF